MDYIDLRKVGVDGLKQIRRQVVRLKKMGKSGKEIEEITGVRQNRISEKAKNRLPVKKRTKTRRKNDADSRRTKSNP